MEPPPLPASRRGRRGATPKRERLSTQPPPLPAALLGRNHSSDEDALAPSHKVSADDDKQNLQALMGVQTTVAAPKQKVSRMRRLSVNLMERVAAKSFKALATSPHSRPGSSGSGSANARTSSAGTSRAGSAGTGRMDSAGTSRAGSATTSRSVDSGGSLDGGLADDDGQSSGDEQQFKQKRGASFVQRMRRLSVENVGRVAVKATGKEAETGEDQQVQLAAQRLAEQNDRRMRAEMRRSKEREERAEREARDAEVEAERKRIAEATARELQKEREKQEQIRRQVERQRHEKEQRELTLRSMGKMAKTREAAMELYMQALAQGEHQLTGQHRPGSAASAGGASTIQTMIGGHWTVEAPAAMSCQISDALDEVKLMAHQISPVKYGGITRDRLVIIAIGGPACSGKSWLGLRLAASAHQGGLEALLLSLDTFTKLATGAVQSPTTVPLHPFLDASSLLPPGHGAGNLDTLATYDLTFARRCMKQLRRDLAAELPARAVSSEQGEGGTGMTTARVPPSKVVVIEGRFALHPMLADVVDLRVHCGGSPHTTLLRSIARHAERELSQEHSGTGSGGCPALIALQELAASTLPMAALYSSRIASCADLLIQNDWSPLGSVAKEVESADSKAGMSATSIGDMGGHTIYGVTVNRGNSTADFNRVAKWIYGIARTSSGRCISLDGPTHLLDYEWLVKPAAGTAAPKRTAAVRASAATVHASVNARNIGTATESMRGVSRGGVSIDGRKTHSADSRSTTATALATCPVRGRASGLPMSAKSEERARERSRKRMDPNSRPWRTKAQPRVATEQESDESDDETMTTAGPASRLGNRASKKPLPPWPEDGSLPPAANVVEAIGMPPRDALDPSGANSRIGADGVPRFWLRISDRAGQYRVVACEKPKIKHDTPGNEDTAHSDQQHPEQARQAGNNSSFSTRKSKHRRTEADKGKAKSRRRNGKNTNGRSLSSRKHRRAAEEKDTKEQRNKDGAVDENAKSNADDESMDGDETTDRHEKDSAPRKFRLPSTSATVPAGVAAWNELALGGEAEGGDVLSQLLAVGYYIDKVQTVQSHSFLVPCFGRGGIDPSADVGLDTPVHAAGGSVLVVVERRTLLGGIESSKKPGNLDNSNQREEEDDEGEQPTVTVRIEGTDPTEVERVGRLITLGTLAAKKLRGVDPDNVAALAGFTDISHRPTTSSSSDLPWLNPWRDNDTPNNSRPASGASSRSEDSHQKPEPAHDNGRPASGSSTGSSTRKRSTGGGYGAGGLVALPVNRSTDINRSQRRVRSREGRPPGGKHGEYWRTNDIHEQQTQQQARGQVATSDSNTGKTGSGMAALAEARQQHRVCQTGQQSSSEEDDFDA